jgi:hypothetical protein
MHIDLHVLQNPSQHPDFIGQRAVGQPSAPNARIGIDHADVNSSTPIILPPDQPWNIDATQPAHLPAQATDFGTLQIPYNTPRRGIEIDRWRYATSPGILQPGTLTNRDSSAIGRREQITTSLDMPQPRTNQILSMLDGRGRGLVNEYSTIAGVFDTPYAMLPTTSSHAAAMAYDQWAFSTAPQYPRTSSMFDLRHPSPFSSAYGSDPLQNALVSDLQPPQLLSHSNLRTASEPGYRSYSRASEIARPLDPAQVSGVQRRTRVSNPARAQGRSDPASGSRTAGGSRAASGPNPAHAQGGHAASGSRTAGRSQVASGSHTAGGSRAASGSRASHGSRGSGTKPRKPNKDSPTSLAFYGHDIALLIGDAKLLYMLRLATLGPVFPDDKEKDTIAEESFVQACSRANRPGSSASHCALPTTVAKFQSRRCRKLQYLQDGRS